MRSLQKNSLDAVKGIETPPEVIDLIFLLSLKTSIQPDQAAQDCLLECAPN